MSKKPSKAKAKPKWKLVTSYPITEYQCGARAGDRVRLHRELVVHDHLGKPIRIHSVGEIWTVLPGAREQTVVVSLRQPDGERNTWSDDAEFWAWFEKTEEPQDGAGAAGK